MRLHLQEYNIPNKQQQIEHTAHSKPEHTSCPPKQNNSILYTHILTGTLENEKVVISPYKI